MVRDRDKLKINKINSYQNREINFYIACNLFITTTKIPIFIYIPVY